VTLNSLVVTSAFLVVSLVALRQWFKYLQAVKGLTSTLEDLRRLKAGETRLVPSDLSSTRVKTLVSSIAEHTTGLGNQGRHLTAMIEAEPECVKTLDASGALLSMNLAGLRMIEAESMEQVRGANVFGLLHPDWHEPFREMHKAVMRGESRQLIFKLVGLKGAQRWMETHAVPLRSMEGELVHLAVTHDITKHKQQEFDLIKAKEHAEASNASKSSFLANMSHELRTPLTAILGYVDVLSQDDCSQQEQDFGFETIQGSANHLLALISDILDVSKIEADMIELECLPFNPSGLVHEIVNSMGARAEMQGIGLSVSVEEPITSTAWSDPLRLRQIVTNLLGNAIKFTHQGAVRVHLDCPPQAPGSDSDLSQLRIRVSDTGVGIAASALDTLFKAFTQANSSTTRQFGGTGLGLTISHRLASMLGGAIGVKSELGKGSEFSLTLELRVAREIAAPIRVAYSPPAALPTQAAPSKQALQGFNARVLLVEDNPVNRKVLRRILETMGLQVEEAVNGYEAVEMSRQTLRCNDSYDLIFLDMHMPVMDGYAAARILKSEEYPAPIVALTASALEDDRDRCLAAGCDDYVTKPIQRELLHGVLARYLGVK
jgi:two-component system CheB/CheR fusion protein